MSETIQQNSVHERSAEAGSAMRFTGKVAAVTGGGSGIGAAICRRLADEGAIVAVVDLAVGAAERLASTLPQAAAIQADVSDSASVEEALTKVETDRFICSRRNGGDGLTL